MSKSTMDDVFAPVEAKYKAEVMFQTWGHQDAKVGEVHHGWFTFIHGQHGDMAVLESDFPTFGEGPGYFAHRDDFIWSKVKNDGPCSEVGLYRFDGSYRLNKRTGSGIFTGKVQRLRHEPVSMPKEDLAYYRHVFGQAARAGTSPSIHATRCKDLHRLLSQVMRSHDPRRATPPAKEPEVKKPEKVPYSRAGTSNYRSEAEARRAYCGSYDEAIAEGRICIGKPELRPGQRLEVDKDGRYWIAVGG